MNLCSKIAEQRKLANNTVSGAVGIAPELTPCHGDKGIWQSTQEDLRNAQTFPSVYHTDIVTKNIYINHVGFSWGLWSVKKASNIG